MIGRREFMPLLGGAVALPFAASAQQPLVASVGLLSGVQLDDRQLGGVRQGLKEAGYIEGRNLAIKYRSASGQSDLLPALLVNDAIAVIVAITPQAALAARSATATIPIVFAIGADPVDLGLVSSFNRPGGNVTGVTFLVNALVAKRLELLRELVPSATSIGFLANSKNPTSQSQISDARAAAVALGLHFPILSASSESDIDAAFESFVQQRVNAVIVAADAFFATRLDQFVSLAARHAMPATYHLREFVVAGGLMSYGTNITNAFRLAAVYAGRILNGGTPADLPVQQSVKFEFIVNLRTAKALGLTVPNTLLVSADEVIE